MFGDFAKLTDRLMREIVADSIKVAPASKGATLAAAAIYAPYLTPVVAALPADVVLAINEAPATGGLSLLILDPKYRPGGKGPEVDYEKLGSGMFSAYLQGR